MKTSLPYHAIYANDVMIFYKCRSSNIEALMHLFEKYVCASGQAMNPYKSTIYVGSISPKRTQIISFKSGFNFVYLPFLYPGVHVFKGKPKACFRRIIAIMIKIKFSAWKASILSIAGRSQLLRSVIQSTILHIFLIYSSLGRKFRDG